MVPVFHPKLVNDPFGDPCLYIDIQRESRAVLFDLGSLETLKVAKTLRVSDVFISHTHMDHFIGFDHLIRLLLGRDKKLRIFGPPGIIGNVEGKLSAYTWNLVDDYAFVIEVHEIAEQTISVASFPARNAFRKTAGSKRDWKDTLIEEPLFMVNAAILDHKTPSLAFSIREKFHININKDALMKLGLPIGPWLNELKKRFREEKPPESRFTVRLEGGNSHEKREFALGDFIENRLVLITRGQKVTYVTDSSGSKKNKEKIIKLAEGSDTLFCEAAFLDADREKAIKKHHLTARDAGEVAREAGVRRLAIFHFSPKYRDNHADLYNEADQEFKKIV